MTRTTRNIALSLLGSVALFGCCLLPGCEARDEEVRDANGNVVGHRRHHYIRPWFFSSGGRGWNYHTSYGGGSSSYFSSGRTTSGSSGGSRTSSGVTSHGGFGSTGHATAGS